MSEKKRICIVGSGNWGSAIAKVVGNNILKLPDKFETEIRMWVFEELIEGRKLSEIINQDHENVKYLPGHKLPENVVAVTDVVEACKDADIYIFVIPHQFLSKICDQLKSTVKKDAIGVSLIKGFELKDGGGIELISLVVESTLGICAVLMGANIANEVVIREQHGSGSDCAYAQADIDPCWSQMLQGTSAHFTGFELKDGGGIELISLVVESTLGIPCAVLMGANIANEVATENYCEATIGVKDAKQGQVLKDMFQADYFRIVVCEDKQTVEVCGALKNIVAVGAGFADGLGYGDNTKAAVIRLGLMEMVKFCEVFYPGSSQSTFLESCGVADLVTTCYGGRNRRVAEAFAKAKPQKSIEELEKEMLNGQKLQGPPTAAEVNFMLKNKGTEDRFPMFTAIHQICSNAMPVEKFMDCLKNHPEHM